MSEYRIVYKPSIAYSYYIYKGSGLVYNCYTLWGAKMLLRKIRRQEANIAKYNLKLEKL